MVRTDLVYDHHAKFGAAWTSYAGAAKKSDISFLFVCLRLRYDLEWQSL